jgi:hypothetical protein
VADPDGGTPSTKRLHIVLVPGFGGFDALGQLEHYSGITPLFDEILSWEKTKKQEKDVRFVELGEYLCEVRAKQYWRLQRLKSFDEFLEKRFVDSRRKAYYPMTIHENLTPSNHTKARYRSLRKRLRPPL